MTSEEQGRAPDDAVEDRPGDSVEQATDFEPNAKAKFNRTMWFVVLLVIGFWAAVNAPYQYTTLSSAGNEATDDFDLDLDTTFHGATVEAGWPLKYFVSHDFSENIDSSQWFALSAAINLSLALACLFVVCWYLRRGARRLANASGSSRAKRASLSLSDLLVFVGIIALPMGYYQRQMYLRQNEDRVEKLISGSAAVQRDFLAPRILVARLPRSMTKAWNRITRVRMLSPNGEDVQAVCQLPYLRSLRIGGGDYDETPLQRLPSMRYLTDLRVAGRPLEASTVQAIAKCDLVSHLNVANTNITDAGLNELAKLPRLKKLIAFGCDNTYEGWESTKLKANLEELYFDRPDTGLSGKVILRGWPKLKKLFIQSRDQFANVSPLSVTIEEMPELEYVELDVFQLMDLKVCNTPKLKQVDGICRNGYRRVADGERAPINIWARNLQLTNVPEMTKLKFYPKDFESLKIEGCEKLEEINVTSKSLIGSEDIEPDLLLPKENRQKVLDSLGKLTGPNTIRLFGLHLDDLDLSVLQANQGVRYLQFHDSVLSVKNIASLAELKKLEGLWFGTAQLQPKILGQVNRQFPEIVSLQLNEQATAIRLEDKPRLQQIHFTNHEESNIDALRLVNVPELTTPLIVNEFGSYCLVKNAPKMKGLGILSPIPTAEVSDVQGLEWFVAGSAAANDTVVTEVLKAKDLSSLTLAYSTAKREAFAGLKELEKLTRLTIPGAALDDQLLSDWEPPDSLTELNLEDCQLSTATIDRIVDRGNWIRLSLSGNEAPTNFLSLFKNSPGLFDLSLGGLNLRVADVKALPDLPAFQSLDLREATIEKGALEQLVNKCFNLANLHLVGATIDNQELSKIIDEHASLKLELNPTDASVAIITQLTSSDRLIRPVDPWMTMRMTSQQQLLGYDAAGRPVYQKATSTKQEFEEPTLDLRRYREFAIRSAQANKTPRQVSAGRTSVDLGGNAKGEGRPSGGAAASVGRTLGRLFGIGKSADSDDDNGDTQSTIERRESTDEVRETPRKEKE